MCVADFIKGLKTWIEQVCLTAIKTLKIELEMPVYVKSLLFFFFFFSPPVLTFQTETGTLFLHLHGPFNFVHKERKKTVWSLKIILAFATKIIIFF